MVKIKYVPKSKLFPSFGYARENTQTVYVRKDLPKKVKTFILEHELYHLKDWKKLGNKKYNWIIGEIKANFYAGFKHPIGFICTIILSLSPSRIKLYIQRFGKGK